MKPKHLFALLILITSSSCASMRREPEQHLAGAYLTGIMVRVDTLTLFDSAQNRVIPISIYNRIDGSNMKDRLPQNIRRKLVLLSPGYGGTRNDYSYIANNLANNGYTVVVIQHDLPGDAPIPTEGDIYKTRKPFWDRGVKTVFFVTAKLKKEYTHLDYKHIILIGHSNGGDISMLMANEYPAFAKTVITLDNRRVPIPRALRPKIFSIRSSDQPADANVLPTAEEQRKYHIKIVKVDTRHNDMGGTANDTQKKEINDYILNFLN